jgi:hypothetical protein
MKRLRSRGTPHTAWRPADRTVRVEIHGWNVEIRILETAQRPGWEIRCEVARSRDGREERRGQRFVVSPEAAARCGLDRDTEAARLARLAAGAKRVVLRDLDAIFAEPEDGLDSVRHLVEGDLQVGRPAGD